MIRHLQGLGQPGHTLLVSLRRLSPDARRYRLAYTPCIHDTPSAGFTLLCGGSEMNLLHHASHVFGNGIWTSILTGLKIFRE